MSTTRLDELDQETLALMALNNRMSQRYPFLNGGDRLPPNLSAAEIQAVADDFNDSFTQIFGIAAREIRAIDELAEEFTGELKMPPELPEKMISLLETRLLV